MPYIIHGSAFGLCSNFLLKILRIYSNNWFFRKFAVVNIRHDGQISCDSNWNWSWKAYTTNVKCQWSHKRNLTEYLWNCWLDGNGRFNFKPFKWNAHKAFSRWLWLEVVNVVRLGEQNDLPSITFLSLYRMMTCLWFWSSVRIVKSPAFVWLSHGLINAKSPNSAPNSRSNSKWRSGLLANPK